MKEAYDYLKLGEIKPRGWIFKQMNRDLTEGFVGHLDKLVPDLILKDDIYGSDRLTKKIKSKDVGAVDKDGDWQVQYLWWNSETQSNWYDGFVRHAILTENKEFISKAKEFVDRILSYQDEDGYMGIYEKDLRFNFNSENGELWAQSSLFRVLLGYYEATGEKRVLNAVQRAIQATMKAYPIYNSTPFKVENSFAGVSHGLTIIDTLEKLYQLTKNKNYLEYAVWLYEDYSSHKLMEEDIQPKNLLNKEYKFKGHGVHTYEHLRALVTAGYSSDVPKYKEALEAYIKKLESCLCPSGGPIGDEWIAENTANPSLNGYEYCSIQELLHSYTLLLQKSGAVSWADKAEWLLFNAGQGARHPEESSIAYLKSDNSYAMEGEFQVNQEYCPHKVQTRYKYSPTHQDAAVCCVPNAGRIYPYYVQSMWMKKDHGLAAVMYGPCSVSTNINGVKISIEEDTLYPFEGNITFTVKPEAPTEFELSFRKPKWCSEVVIKADGAKIDERDNILIVKKLWNYSDKVEISFEYPIKMNKDLLQDNYISHGPLVFALPIKGVDRVAKELNVGNFRDLKYAPAEAVPSNLKLTEELLSSFSINRQEVRVDKLWSDSISIKGNAFNASDNTKVELELVPMGGTVLRKVTFK